MTIPPREVPDGLTADEYTKLAARYSLMGWGQQEGLAQMRAQTLSQSGEGEISEETEEQMAAGAELAQVVMQLLTQSVDDDEQREKAFDDAMQKLKGLGMSDEDAEKLFSALTNAFNSSMELPPKDVPEELSAQEYYQLGVRYKDIGWTEQARDALQYAIDLEPDGPSGKSALTFLRTKVPRHPVPMMAVDGNIQGFNQMAAGEHEAARETFERLIGDYPTFEWPYGNLGSLLLYLGEPESARKVLEKALEINPFYLNAMLHLARVHAVMENHDEALKLLDSAASIDPSDVRVSQIRDTVANSQ